MSCKPQPWPSLSQAGKSSLLHHSPFPWGCFVDCCLWQLLQLSVAAAVASLLSVTFSDVFSLPVLPPGVEHCAPPHSSPALPCAKSCSARDRVLLHYYSNTKHRLISGSWCQCGSLITTEEPEYCGNTQDLNRHPPFFVLFPSMHLFSFHKLCIHQWLWKWDKRGKTRRTSLRVAGGWWAIERALLQANSLPDNGSLRRGGGG